MRLLLSIFRHKLPPTEILWTIREDQTGPAFTIARLLEEIDPIVPLQADDWDYEDYVVEVQGYECLHFAQVRQSLKDGDKVCIRPLETSEIRARAVAGRTQITVDGRHLIDGIPFGRPYIREPMRPTIHIPPRKRQRLITAEDFGEGDAEMDDPRDEEDTELDSTGAIPVDWKLRALPNGEGVEGVEASEKDTGYNLRTKGHNPKSVRFVDQPEEENESEDDSSFADEESHAPSSGASSSDEAEDSSFSGSKDDSSDASESSTSSSGSSDAESSDSEDSGASSGPEIQVSNSTNRSEELGNAPTRSGRSAARNKRRLLAKKRVRLISMGLLPASCTLADVTRYMKANGGAPAKQPEFAKGDPAPVNNPNSETLDPEFQRRRQELLRQLHSGEGIDINLEARINQEPKSNNRSASHIRFEKGTSVAKETEETSTAVPQSSKLSSKRPRSDDDDATEASAAQGTFSSQQPVKRARLDLEDLDRRASKTLNKPDELIAKLKKSDKALNLKSVLEQAQGASKTSDPDAWKSKINLSAFECWHEEYELSAPPFPFKNRWDPQCEEMQAKGKKKKGKNGKAAAAAPRQAAEEQAIQFQLQAERENEPDEAEREDLPPLPADLSSLQVLTPDDIKAGNVIVFKHFICNADTDWCPSLSSFKTAQIVVECTEEKTIGLRLARRDQNKKQKKFDAHGNRIYEAFDAPDAEDFDDRYVSDGNLYEPFENLVEARLLQAADTASAGANETNESGSSTTTLQAEGAGEEASGFSRVRLHPIPSTSPPPYPMPSKETSPGTNDPAGTDQEMMLVKP